MINNPQVSQFESLSKSKLVSTSARVFSDLEEEKLLSVLRRSIDEKRDLSEETKEELESLMKKLVDLSIKDSLQEDVLLDVAKKFNDKGLSNLEDLRDYLTSRKYFDIASLIRNSQEEFAKDVGDVDLLVRLDKGSLDDITKMQQNALEVSSKPTNVLINNVKRLSDTISSSSDSKILSEFVLSQSGTNKSYDQVTKELESLLEKNTELSEDTKTTLNTISLILKDKETKSISDKIKSMNTQDILEDGFKNLGNKLDNIKTDGGILKSLGQASTAEELGSSLGDAIFGRLKDKNIAGSVKSGAKSLASRVTTKSIGSSIGTIAKVFTKVAAPLAAIADVGFGVKDLIEGKTQEEAPTGWNAASPMHWGMWAGNKLNQGYGAASKFFGGSGSLGSDIAGAFSKDPGGLSSRYESGSKGSAAIGYDQVGGASYGKYQISTKTGSMARFMEYAKSADPAIYKRLSSAGGAADPNGGFGQEWQALAKEGKLSKLEDEFIKSTNYAPALRGIKDKSLVKMIESNKTLQDVLWSTAVQHGASGAASIFNSSYKQGMSPQDLVKSVYASRSTKFGSSEASVQASVRNRLAREQSDALGSLSIASSSSNTEAENLRSQGMSTSMIKTLTGVDLDVGRSSSGTSTSVPSVVKLANASTPASETGSQSSTQPTVISPISSTIINTTASSAFNMDVARYNMGM